MGIAWACLQIPIAFASGVSTLIVCRALLGIAEGPALPVAVHSVCKWFPDDRRSMPVAVIAQGACLGLVLAGFLIPTISARWGWRMNFIVLGVAGVAWSVMWLCFGREGRLQGAVRPRGEAAHAQTGEAERLPYFRVLLDRSVLLLFLLGFCTYWLLGVMLTWVPAYLEKGLGFSSVMAGRWFGIVMVASMPVTLILSAVSQRLLRRGATTRAARAWLVCGCMLVGAAALMTLVIAPLPADYKPLLLAFACALPGIGATLGPVMLGEIVPPSQRGAFLSFFTAFCGVAGVVAPMMMGLFVQRYGSADVRGYESGLLCGALLLTVVPLAGFMWLDPARSRQMLQCTSAPPIVTA
jgi:MFS family permease